MITEKKLIRTIRLGDQTVTYELTYKKVKNINLRIKADGTVCVSTNRRVPQRLIDGFLESKADWIIKGMEKRQERKPMREYFSDEEVRKVILSLCREKYPYFAEKGIAYPEIKFRKMVACWGNCRSNQGIITFNTALKYAPLECIEYVVLHEFTHFLQANHSAKFYEELTKVCPDWKTRRNMLKEIQLR